MVRLCDELERPCVEAWRRDAEGAARQVVGYWLADRKRRRTPLMVSASSALRHVGRQAGLLGGRAVLNTRVLVLALRVVE